MHAERKHSKYGASGFARICACPGSVALSEGLKSKDSAASIEGTKAHEVLETMVRVMQAANALPRYAADVPREMIMHAKHAAKHIIGLSVSGDELLIEAKVSLDFISPEAFGTLDYAVVKHFGTLHVLDFKFGKKHVSPVENKQFIFYALAVANRYDWNFKRVRMWTLQPRSAGFDGNYQYWEISILELKEYIKVFRRAIERAENHPDEYNEGEHCYFCAAKGKCPLKQQGQLDKAMLAFAKAPIKRSK